MKMTNNKQPGKQWWVRLGQSKFKVTIVDSANLKLETALASAERIPIAYRRALEVVSEDQKAGLAFYKTLGGAAAHGGQAYLNMIPLKGNRAASVIAHEAGHVLEQRARSAEKDILDRWAEAVKADNIDVSPYGNQANAEDQAEFARLYAYCIDSAVGKDMKEELKKLSPERFELWEHMLHKSKALPISDLDAELRKRAMLSEEMKPKLAQVRKTIRKLVSFNIQNNSICRCKNDLVISLGSQVWQPEPIGKPYHNAKEKTAKRQKDHACQDSHNTGKR